MTVIDEADRAAAREVPTDAERRDALRRMKRVATGLLVVAAFVFAVSFGLQDSVPWLAYVRAAAACTLLEAGMCPWSGRCCSSQPRDWA